MSHQYRIKVELENAVKEENHLTPGEVIQVQEWLAEKFNEYLIHPHIVERAIKAVRRDLFTIESEEMTNESA